jgi:hypothetical protein
MNRMVAFPAHAVHKARNYIARSAYLIARQEAIIESLDGRGRDIRLACALLYTMYRSRMLMMEYLDQVSGATPTSEPPVVETDRHVHPRESLDDWLQLLTLAMNPHQGPNGPH